MAEADPRLDELADTFDLLGDWEERYRYVIELGRGLEPMPDAAKTDATKVSGCASQVWLLARPNANGTMTWLGDSDAHIVRGLIAILLDLYSGRTPQEVLNFDAKGAIQRLGLSEALSSQRSNGLNAMIQRIRSDAAQASR